MESILGDGEVLSGQIRVTAKKNHNFLSDSWTQIFRGVYRGCFPWSCYGIDTRDGEVWSEESRVRAKKCHNF